MKPLYRHLATVLIALAAAGQAAVARAEVVFGGMTGYAQGTLTRQVDEKFTSFAAQAYVGYQFWKMNAHAFFETMDLSYEHGGETYNGIYGLTGLGLTFAKQAQIIRRPQKIVAMVQLPLSGTYSVLTESSGTVNDTNYVHSSLTTLQGGSALQVLVGTEWLGIGRGATKTGENFYFGGYLGYLTQSFARQATRIKTNNSTLAPPSPGSERVSYKVVVISLNFAVSYDL